MAKNYKPTGLSIVRDNLKFTLTWTPKSKYNAQKVEVYMDDSTTPVATLPDVAKNTKTKSYTVPQASYQPTTEETFKKITFKVSGKIGKKWYTESKSYSVKAPKVPKYIKPANVDNQAYTYGYSWDRHEDDSKDDTTMFKEYQWDTVVVSSNVASGKQLDEQEWAKYKSQTITLIDINTGRTITNHPSTGSTTDGSIIIVDNPSVVASGLRRFVRVRARSAAGSSDYQYSDHAFSAPIEPKLDFVELKISDDEKISGSIGVTAITTDGQPVDTVTLQYAITKPKTVETTKNNTKQINITLPDQDVSWYVYRSFNTTGTKMTLTFTVDTPLDENNCLFMRASVSHDNEVASSLPYLVYPPQRYISLTPPVITSCTLNPSNNTVNIGVNNPADLENNKSFVAVFFRTSSNQKPEKPIGILPYGTSSDTFKIPAFKADDDVSFGVQTFVANYSPATYSGALTYFDISEIKMRSDSIVWDDSSIPKPPSNVSLTRLKEGVIQVTWDWPWVEANCAELSWSDDPDAWESTNEPQTYTVTNLYSGKWNIAGLSAGTWYVRVRLIQTTEESTLIGTYSETKKITLSSAPNTPALTLEPNVIPLSGQTTAYWEFSSTDGTGQSYAELAEAIKEDDKWSYTPLSNAATNTGKSISFSPSDYGWEDGSTHYISIRVTSASGMDADWSQPVPLGIASAPVLSVSGFDWSTENSDNVLSTLPLSFTVTGAGKSGYTTAVITRRQGFDIPRPDDSTEHGYEGEVIASKVIDDVESAEFKFDLDDTNLLGHFDDDALYALNISITDSFGQSASSDPYNFRVKWAEQAVMPSAIVEVDKENEVTYITPVCPDHSEGAYCDVYRLSVDKPELIMHKAEFGVKYVDPYPTYGAFGGYRVVYVTKYGDYRLDTGEESWTDYSPDEEEYENRIDYLNKFAVTIDFDGYSIDLPYDVSLSNTWSKDFTTTKYLGGAQEGDWTPGVNRTGSYKVRIPVEHDRNMVYMARLLADYAGVCHVRTPEGSNFYANVDVQEDREEKLINRLASISLKITKVDSIGYDGMKYADWTAGDE